MTTTTMFWLILLSIMCAALAIVSFYFNYEYTEPALPELVEYELLSLYNDSKVKGNFFLGCGSLDGKEYYFGFIKEQNGMIHRLQLPTYRTYIVESEGSPKLVIKISEYTVIRDSFPHNLRWLTSTNKYLYIPKGTIIRRFHLK